jgi:GNAT superfamily N-acetyltransferase
VIRPAVGEDVARLRDVEIASGALFRDVGMAAIADDEPMWLGEWDRYVGGTWVYEVALPERSSLLVVGFAMTEPLGEALHLEQLSVDPAFGRRGIGAALVEHVCAAAGGRDVTLTTFRDVPWNMPFYERLGFIEAMPPSDALRRRIEEEAAAGLDPSSRVAMIYRSRNRSS